MAPLFLRFGVTTIHDVGNDLNRILTARERERRDEIASARIVAYGPLLDGLPLTWPAISLGLSNVQEARAAVQELIQQGVDGLKVYRRLPLHLVRTVCAVARERGVPVAAHLDAGVVSAREAAEAGVWSIEHGSGIDFLRPSEPHYTLIEYLCERHVFLVPTLRLDENRVQAQELLDRASAGEDSCLHLAPQEATAWWLRLPAEALRGNHTEAALRAKGGFVRTFHAGGGKVVVGSDAPNPFAIPGISLHQELERLVAAGLSPMDAIRAATSVAAEALRRPDLGITAEGNMADLVLVAGNPLEDITAARNIRMVVKGGAMVHEAGDAVSPR